MEKENKIFSFFAYNLWSSAEGFCLEILPQMEYNSWQSTK